MEWSSTESPSVSSGESKALAPLDRLRAGMSSVRSQHRPDSLHLRGDILDVASPDAGPPLLGSSSPRAVCWLQKAGAAGLD